MRLNITFVATVAILYSCGAGAAEGEVADQKEWVTVEIPQLGGSIKMPSDWHRPTSEQAMQSLDHLAFSSEDERGRAEMSALSVGRMRLWITRDPEPNPNFNPGVDILWNAAPATLEQVPPECRGEALTKFMAMALIPQIKGQDDKFRLLEGPKPLKNGAWATFVKGQKLKNGETVEAVVRLILMMADNKLVIVSLLLPVERHEAEKIYPVVWEMFKSLKIGGTGGSGQ